ncbi:MAG: proline dehydrogenase family protein [Halobacteriaceae archaeon]
MLPPIADKFVAGETADAALDRAETLSGGGRGAILNLLGEHHDDPETVAADVAAYRDLIDAVADSDARACISVKPTQLGLDLGVDAFDEHVDAVVDHAAERDVFCWLDMEDSSTTAATLDAFERLTRRHDGGVGVCVQANLRRTPDDLARLADLPGKVRLVKGAYDEPEGIAHRGSTAITRAYRGALEYMFEHFEDGVAVATHDPAMIDAAVSLHDQHGTPFEFQMLMGVREDAQRELAAEYDVWQYVPYGSRWFAYFTRRVAERRENLAFALRAVAGLVR